MFLEKESYGCYVIRAKHFLKTGEGKKGGARGEH